MRHCPSTAGSAPPPLITHRIGVEVCLVRHRTFFHKCHRCIFRGQAATWEPEETPVAVDLHTDEEPVVAAVKTVAIPHPNGTKKASGSKKPSRAKRAGVPVS